MYPELALYSSNIECARTDTVIFPKSQICTRGVTLTLMEIWTQVLKNLIMSVKFYVYTIGIVYTMNICEIHAAISIP